MIFKTLKYTFILIFSLVCLHALADTDQLGDLAPRGATDGQLNAGDIVIMQQLVTGDLNPPPTNDELTIGDVAPLNAPDGNVNAADLLILQRAVLGEITLGMVDITPPAPTLNPVTVTPTNENPYAVTGMSIAGATIDIYLNGVLETTTTALPDGSFATTVVLVDGTNTIDATANTGGDPSPFSFPPLSVVFQLAEGGTFGGVISGSVTLNQNTRYLIDSSITISSGATLTIEQGAELTFGNVDITVNDGYLFINGTSERPVLLTADFVSSPTTGSWSGVSVNAGALGAVINYADISNAFIGVNFFNSGSVGVVSNSFIHDNSIGVQVWGDASPLISSGNTITLNTTGVKVFGTGTGGADVTRPIVTGNSIYSNPKNYDALGFPSVIRLDATGNWWGTLDPDAIALSIGDYTDSLSRPVVDFGPWLDSAGGNLVAGNYLSGPIISNTSLSADTIYDVIGYLRVAEGVTLTIDQGAVLRFINTTLSVAGTLNVQGTANNKVLLTSIKSSPEQADWNGIVLLNTSVGTIIDQCSIAYSRKAVVALGASGVTIKNSEIINNGEGIKFTLGTTGLIENNNINYNGALTNTASGNGITLDNSSPDVTGNEIRGNLSDGISLISSSSQITNNNIYENRNGINASGSNFNPVITFNAIHNNSNRGFVFIGTGNDATNGQPIFSDNDIYGNGRSVIAGYGASSTITLDLSNNWWGTTTPNFNDGSLLQISSSPPVTNIINTSPFRLTQIYTPTFTNLVQDVVSIKPSLGEQVTVQFDLSKAATVIFAVMPRFKGLIEIGADPIYIEQKIINSPGTYSFSWNGKDMAGNYLADDAFIYKLYIENGSVFDKYIPSPIISNGFALSGGNFDVSANTPYRSQVNFDVPTVISLQVTPVGENTFQAINDVVFEAGTSFIFWNGRRPDGSAIVNQNVTPVGSGSLLPTNTIIVKGSTPTIQDTRQNLPAGVSIAVKSDPYIVRHSYDEISQIMFQIDQDSNVTVKLLPPGVFDPNDSSARVLMPTTLLNAESAPGVPEFHMVEWIGYDDSVATPDTNDALIDQEGMYTFTIEATSNITGFKTLYRGALNLYY